MKTPEKFSIGIDVDHMTASCILDNSDARKYHSAHMNGGSYKAFRAGEDLVMFTAGIRYISGHDAGTHDGIRDSARSGRADFSGAFRAYCSKSEWIKAGNAAFWDE